MEFLATNRRRLSSRFARSSGGELKAAVFAGYEETVLLIRVFNLTLKDKMDHMTY